MSSAPPETLLRLEEPLRVSTNGTGAATAEIGSSDNALEESKSAKAPASPNGDAVPRKTTSGSAQTDDIVNSVLPPRRYAAKDGSAWMQYTSKEPATRLDVIQIQEELDRKLAARQARLAGLCPVREDLYRQTMDELIRQVTLNQPERGLLLLRVRDEARMTLDAYKTLYDSSIVFGVRKQLQAEEGVADLEQEIAAMEEECAKRRADVGELRSRAEMIEKREAELKAIADKKRKDEVAFLKYQGQNLDKFLKSVSGSA